MLISKTRHEREKADAIAKATRLNEEILGGLPQAIFLLDHDLRIRPPISRSAESLFRRRDLLNTAFEKLLENILPAKPLVAAAEFLTLLRSPNAPADINAGNPLLETAVRITAAEGAVENRILSFTFRRVVTLSEHQTWVVCIEDISRQADLARELEELKGYSSAQATCLGCLVRVGSERFAAFLRQSDASVNMINAVLKKPARTREAFRAKLDELLHEIDQIKQQAALLELDNVEQLAQAFADAATGLQRNEHLSGSDFLPLAVRLDELFAQLALMRSMTSLTGSQRSVAPPQAAPAMPAAAPGRTRHTTSGTEIMEAPQIAALSAAAAAAAVGLPPPLPAARPAPAGSLESALRSMAEHVAQSRDRSITLDCAGLAEVPAAYQGLVKNIVIQLIRNAIMHGIEPPAEREAAGKPAFGHLALNFRENPGQGFQLAFEDDGRGLDAAQLRETAIAKGMLTPEAAAEMPDRQAIKLIFKRGFSTVADPSPEVGRGMGMALVRRYVAEAGGKVGLASVPGRQTRFRISLPALPAESAEPQVA
ncbi:MAG: ATP-binding protein [Steroidobacteraceae bacterium]